LAWFIMVVINYHSHKKYIIHNKDKFIKILNENYATRKKLTIDDSVYFSFTPENIEKREFSKYLKMGKFLYLLSDTTQIMFSIVLIFILAYSLEYLPFVHIDKTVVDYNLIWLFVLFGYAICLLDAYSKTLKYDKIICSWKKGHPDQR
ncbi:MAG: hypothetical protein PHF33_07985, partial [Candidatus Delongbacteria bacterium]|nr:hypothetical protein [Candidatus Delongbacteria bacterium]